MGVDTGQGYYFHRPLDAEAALALGPNRLGDEPSIANDSVSGRKRVFEAKPEMANSVEIPPPLEAINFGGLLSKRRRVEESAHWETPSRLASASNVA
jgi:hypothetical protein